MRSASPSLGAPEPVAEVVDPSSVTVAIEGWNAMDLQSRRAFEQSLASLRDQTFPIEKCEVLVVLEAESAPDEIPWIREYLPHAKIFTLPGATYYRSKNLALKAAKAEYLVFADSDVVYEPQWLGALLGSFRPGVDLVVGYTRYQPGLLSRTRDLCDWSATRIGSGFTDWFYGNNMAARRSLLERLWFREDFGVAGGASVNVVRAALIADGVFPWFCAEARGHHYLKPLLRDRLRIGGFHLRLRRLAPDMPGARLARLPVLSPFLVTMGTLIMAWRRAWRLRSLLPLRSFSLPLYLLTVAALKGLEAIGAAAHAWTPGWISRRYGWFDIPPAGQPRVVEGE